MNQNQELVLRAICAFEKDGYAHFVLSNSHSVMKSDSLKKILKELERLKAIEDVTTNGYAKKIKILNHLDCPEFIFEDIELKIKKYLLTRYNEYTSGGECITFSSIYEDKLKQLGISGDIVKNQTITHKDLEASGEIQYTEFGYKIITFTGEKVPYCEKCGEKDPSQFYSGRKNICKKCLTKELRNETTSLEQKLLKRSQSNARHLNVEHNLDLLFIHDMLKSQNNKCKYSGIEFGDSFLDKYTYPTLDRIDSSKGYTKDNVCLCTWYVNTMKNNASTEQFKTTIKQIYENLNNF